MALTTIQKGLRITFGRKELQNPELQLKLTQRLVTLLEELNKQEVNLAGCTICFAELDTSQPGTPSPLSLSQTKGTPLPTSLALFHTCLNC